MALNRAQLFALTLTVLVGGITGCNKSSEQAATTGAGGSTAGGSTQTVGRTFFIKPGKSATTEMLVAMVQAKPKDVIQFDCGYFELGAGLQLNGTEDVLIKGCGKDKTVLSFKNSTTQEGILASNVRGITVQDLTILDTPGDGIKFKGVNHGTLLRVRTIWSSGKGTAAEDTIDASNFSKKMAVACTDPARHNPSNPNPLETDNTSPDYIVSTASGRYGIYPVESENILVEEAESIGASDAGIYVGQTNTAIIRRSRAAFNVFGFEIENVQGGEYADNVAECNTGGFLVYDLDGLTRYGKRTRVYRNISRNNNTYNFATPGSIVSNVPRGSGFITLGYDKIDIFDNEFSDNSTAGIILTSYDLFGLPGDRRLDSYSESVHIYNNRFKNNGNDMPTPDFATILATGGEQVSTALPMVVALKNLAGGGGYRGAHIIWDGYADSLNKECAYPKDEKGQPIPADEEGKPIQGNRYPNPECRYNAYKFDSKAQRITPKWWFACIDPDNRFDGDSLAYSNFHGLHGLEALDAVGSTDPAVLTSVLSGLPKFPSTFDISEHDCPKRFGSNLPPLAPVVIEPFKPSGGIDPAPSEETVSALCTAKPAAGEVNAAAYAVNCPNLAQYNLFSDALDPTSLPNGNGLPFTLNSKLFTDHAIKHRVVFLPTGQPATYRDINDGVNATIQFPVGTIIAKTFSFAKDNVETPFETRLLIKRQRRDGQVYWDGLEYLWSTENGQRVAKLTLEGGLGKATWDFTDVETGTRHSGSTEAYEFPNANQCIICHSSNDKETGAAPIGPKPRNLNRPYRNESAIPNGQSRHPVTGVNQLQYWCGNGFMTNCPSELGLDAATQIAKAVERNPAFNKPGDSGFEPDSKKDIEARARAYLEINCAHCHNPQGQASNTGFYLDVKRAVNGTHGICKKPTASGSEGRGGRLYDIYPGRAADSILPYRIGPEAKTLAARMPPLARSAVHEEALTLINRWINEVVDNSYEGADGCNEPSGGGWPVALPAPLNQVPVPAP